MKKIKIRGVAMRIALLGRIHHNCVLKRRVRVLAQKLGTLIPPRSRILDVGTGDGQIALHIAQKATDASIEGIDIMLRPHTHIPVSAFDGEKIPFEDKSVDVVTFVDVLHHIDDPGKLIEEASRVAQKFILIKDHLSENKFDDAVLMLMDWVGNAPHGVVLPYNYASRANWMAWFDVADLNVDRFDTSVPLYPFPFNLVFGRKLHFVARLVPVE